MGGLVVTRWRLPGGWSHDKILRSLGLRDVSMAVPKRKHSNSRTGTRRAHDALTPRGLQYCPKCSTAKPSHVICPKCGDYMGRTVVETEE